MSQLFIARYRPGIYKLLTPTQAEHAEQIAKRLFGWEYVRAPDPYAGEQPDPLEGEPSGEVEFYTAHAFQYSKTEPEKIGWMVIVSNETFEQMKKIIEWPYGPFCLLYDIEIIPLNEDYKNPRLQLVYGYMTPAQWGPTMSA